MKLYNTLSRKKEEFVPIKPGKAGMYSCGPTVYNYAHIGNMRTYVFMDMLRRTLEAYGFKVKSVMNITDVGHLTSDADEGEDKMARAAKEQKKTPWEIAQYYTDVFFKDLQALNIKRPNLTPKATEHIKEMLDFVQGLVDKGYGYETRAFHPGEKTSWQRNIAYPRLGFDSFKCGDDMDVPQTDEHGYVSDDSDFRQVIWEFEHKQEGTPLFLFNVTIQNHGAYTVEDYPAEVTVEDAPGAYPKAEQYLTLANKTDEAFRQLVEYFEQQTEPTIIVMFGDHQPSIEQEFLDMAYGVSEDGMTMEQYMDKFKVPFVIWANYPLTGEKPGITSLNFLAQYVLRDAGIQTSAFGSYLWNLTKTIPAMTFAGYFDSEGNAYSHLETTEMTDLIRQYQTVQYNELFGGTDRQSSLFAAPVS